MTARRLLAVLPLLGATGDPMAALALGVGALLAGVACAALEATLAQLRAGREADLAASLLIVAAVAGSADLLLRAFGPAGPDLPGLPLLFASLWFGRERGTDARLPSPMRAAAEAGVAGGMGLGLVLGVAGLRLALAAWGLPQLDSPVVGLLVLAALLAAGQAWRQGRGSARP